MSASSERPSRARWWTLGYREARAHALILAVIMWTGMAIVTFGSPGTRNLIGHVKGEDFVQIYTVAHAAFEGPYPTLRTQAAFHQRQGELVPASQDDHYLPVYPPTAALLFRPLAALSYEWAALAWVVITVLGYGVVVWTVWRPEREALPDRRFLIYGAAAFPPFFLLILHGQTTLIPLLSFYLCYQALRAARPVAAGLALGLLSVKPQFLLVVGAVFVLSFTWRILLGLALSVAGQALAVAFFLGTQAFAAYWQTIKGMPRVEYLLEPDAWRMHSLRTLTRLIPAPGGDLMWAVISVLIIIISVRVWRSDAPLGPRFGILLIATVLVNPHLFGYDAVVLALPIIWLGAWVEATRPPLQSAYWHGVYGLAALLLLPTALFMRVQGSVLIMLWLFWRMSRELMASEAARILSSISDMRRA